MRLTDALRRFAHQPADHKQKAELGDEDGERAFRRCALRGERCRRYADQNRSEQKAAAAPSGAFRRRGRAALFLAN